GAAAGAFRARVRCRGLGLPPRRRVGGAPVRPPPPPPRPPHPARSRPCHSGRLTAALFAAQGRPADVGGATAPCRFNSFLARSPGVGLGKPFGLPKNFYTREGFHYIYALDAAVFRAPGGGPRARAPAPPPPGRPRHTPR